MKIRGAVMGDRVLTAEQVEQLASLPSRDELIARLLGQMQGPISGLARVLNGPISGLARVLQAPELQGEQLGLCDLGQHEDQFLLG